MKELYTVITQYSNGTNCIDQYYATSQDEIKKIIINNLISANNIELSEREKQLIKMSLDNHNQTQMILLEDTVNAWYLMTDIKIEINVIKTSRLIICSD